MRKHSGQYFRCSRCDFYTVNKSHLVEHMETHSGVKHKCNLCHKHYSSVKVSVTKQAAKFEGLILAKCWSDIRLTLVRHLPYWNALEITVITHSVSLGNVCGIQQVVTLWPPHLAPGNCVAGAGCPVDAGMENLPSLSLSCCHISGTGWGLAPVAHLVQ